MKIAISMEMTLKLRDTWHAALNHEWYEFLDGHDIVPLSCHGPIPDTSEFDLVILTGGQDMPDIKTWRNNSYPLRDTFETNLIKQCISTKTPIMGICRGQHFLNYTMGGTHVLMDQPYDNVEISLTPFNVTCHHSIRIDKLAPGFDVLLEDSKGVKELVIDNERKLIGVGWHPERKVNEHTRKYILEVINGIINN